MTELRKLIVDCSTGETTLRDFTAEEIAEAEAVAADKESGNQKLKDLGLTDDEIAAITS